METDDGSNAAEFWAERTAILWECMLGHEAERCAAILTLRWCKRHGHAEPSDTRWRLFAAGLRGMNRLIRERRSRILSRIADGGDLP
jgi:hypothetical protein